MGFRLTACAALRTALIASALGGAIPAPAVADGPGREFFGMQSWIRPAPSDVALMRRGGIGTLRTVFAGNQGTKGLTIRWQTYDALMAAAARERIEVLPTLLGSSHGRPHRPLTPAGLRKWSAFVGDVARRYGRGGTFWDEHGELEPMPLTAYQVWNEPNIPAYWRPVTDVAGYMALVRLTRERLRAVDPSATIVLAGLPDSRLGMPSLDYLRAIYAQPGARSAFDIVALNPYARYSTGVLRAVKRARNVLNRRGAPSTPIWITELGWSTGAARSEFRTTRAGQAERIHKTLTALIAARERLRLQRVIWFGLQDRPFGATEKPWWGPGVGLFDVRGKPKPGWATFVGFTGGLAGGKLHAVAGRDGRATR